MAGVSALIRDGGQVGGGNLAVLTFVLLLEFLDTHVPRGLLRLERGRTVVIGSHSSRIDTCALNLHGHPATAGGVRGGSIVGQSAARLGGGLQGCPAGGATLAAVLVPVLTGKPVRRDVAMSGEPTLAGTVRAGRRDPGEGAWGACPARMAAVLPSANEADVAESFGDGLPCGIRVHYAKEIDDVLAVVLPDVVA